MQPSPEVTYPAANCARAASSRAQAAVAYAERQGLAYDVRDAAGGEKLRVRTAKPHSKPMAPWPIPVPESEWNRLIFPEPM